LQKGGGTIDLEPRLSHTSAVEPTLAPVAVERTMTTRAAASVIFFSNLFFSQLYLQLINVYLSLQVYFITNNLFSILNQEFCNMIDVECIASTKICS
jgi:hypothetical protein